jgi:hypothetical protein
LEMTGFARADIRALYRRDWVALEGPDTHGIMKRAGGQERSPGKRAGWLRAEHGLGVPPPAAANVSAMARSTALMIRSSFR